MAKQPASPTIATNVSVPFELKLDAVKTNEITDTQLSIDLHTTRKARADAERIKYVADNAEYQRDIAKLTSETSEIRVAIAQIKKEVTAVKRDTDKVIAVHNTSIMQSNARLAANRDNNKQAQVTRAINKSASQGVALTGTDYTISINLPTFGAGA